MNAHIPALTRQRGASLVVSLIMLVLLTLIGVSALTVSNTQSRLAGNIVLQTRASQEADSALSQAENWLAQAGNTATLVAFDGTQPGLVKSAPGAALIDPLADATWSDTNSKKLSDTQRYVIEVYATGVRPPGSGIAPCTYGEAAQCPDINVFRVTARGVAPGGATRFVQSVFAVRVIRN